MQYILKESWYCILIFIFFTKLYSKKNMSSDHWYFTVICEGRQGHEEATYCAVSLTRVHCSPCHCLFSDFCFYFA